MGLGELYYCFHNKDVHVMDVDIVGMPTKTNISCIAMNKHNQIYGKQLELSFI